MMQPGSIVAQRYRLGRLIGEGGMGRVFAAEHLVTGRALAVKILEHRGALPPGAVDRFLREARAPAKIGHPGVVEVFDAGTEPDGTPYIAMELLEGETLEEKLRREHVVHPGALARILGPLLETLDAMHTSGFVHRDLKPANVFLVENAQSAQNATGTPTVRLLDFGIAKDLVDDGHTRTGHVVGTPAYMAPEQMRNARRATPRSDLWSVGAMLFECLVGYRPFRGNTYGLLATITSNAVSPSLADVPGAWPPGLVDLVSRLLAKDPSRRPLRASDARAELIPLLAQCPPVTPHATPPDETDSTDESHDIPTQGPALERLPTAAASVPPAVASAPVAAASSSPPRWQDGPPASLPPPRAPWTFDTPVSSPAPPVVRVPVTDARAPRLWPFFALAGAALVTASLAAWWAEAHRTPAVPPEPVTATHPDRLHPSPVATDPDLDRFLKRWEGTVRNPYGADAFAPFYSQQVYWRTQRELKSPNSLQDQWQKLARTGGTFTLDYAHSTWFEARVGAGSEDAVCRTAIRATPGATDTLTVVRAHATEYDPGRSSAVPCPRLEGVYLLWMVRDAQGERRVCHETWSLREGLCASCPLASGCR